MKNLITLLLALISFTITAQSDSTVVKSDTTEAGETEIDLGDVKIIVKDKKKKSIKIDDKEFDYEENDDDDRSDYPNVEFHTSFSWGVTGFNTEVTQYGPLEDVAATSTAKLDLDYSKCRNYVINGNLMINFTRNIGLLTGFGFDFNRFVFKENLQVTPNEGYFQSDSIISFGSYKFKTNYIQIPLMLKFQTNNEKWKVAFGGTFSYNIGSKVKQEYTIENAEYKTTIKGNYNVAPIKLSVGARLAYKGIGIYANYGLTNMNDKVIMGTSGRTNLMPFTAGITFGGL